MTHSTPKSCPCEWGQDDTKLNDHKGEWCVRCGGCGHQTMYCPDPATAVRVWNAGVDAADPECVGMVGLKWEVNAIMLKACPLPIGGVYQEGAYWICELLGLTLGGYHKTVFEARAALLAHVMGS